MQVPGRGDRAEHRVDPACRRPAGRRRTGRHRRAGGPTDAASRWASRRTSASEPNRTSVSSSPAPRSTNTWSGPLTSTSVTPGSRSSDVQRPGADAVPAQRLDRLDHRGVGDAPDPRRASRRRRRRGRAAGPARPADRGSAPASNDLRLGDHARTRSGSAGRRRPAPSSTSAAGRGQRRCAPIGRADRRARRPRPARVVGRSCRAAAARDPRPPLSRRRQPACRPAPDDQTDSQPRHRSARRALRGPPPPRAGRPGASSTTRSASRSGLAPGQAPASRQVDDGQLMASRAPTPARPAAVPRPAPSPGMPPRAIASTSTPSTVGSCPPRSPRCPRALASRGQRQPSTRSAPEQQIQPAAVPVGVDAAVLRCHARAAAKARPAAKRGRADTSGPTDDADDLARPVRGAPRSAIAPASHPAPSGRVITAAPSGIDHW